MLKLTVTHDFAADAAQPLPPAWMDELRCCSSLPVADAAEKLLSWLLRLEDAALGPSGRLSGLRVLFDICCELQRRGEAAQTDHGLGMRRLWRRLHEDCKLLARMDSGRASGLFGGGRPLQEALGLALSSGWQLLRAHVLGYAPLFAGFWQDCHQLFAEARDRGWERRAPGSHKLELGACYRQLLLLGMSASNRLDAARQRLLLDWVGEHGRHLRLAAPRCGEEGAARWLVMAGVDSPGRFAAEQPAAQDEMCWQVDADKVLDRLREHAQRRQQQTSAAAWQLLARLEREWRSPPQRRHHRLSQRQGQSVALLGGFEPCWQLARDGRLPEGAQPAELLVGNLSASGMRLRGDFSGQDLQAGEVAMIKRHGFDWQLGLVRWISLPGGDQPAECGIEFVGKRPRAVRTAAVTSHPDGVMESGLLLHAERQFRRSGVLVLPGRQYQALRPFRLSGDNGEWLVRAQRLLQQTDRCQLMEIRLDEAEPAG